MLSRDDRRHAARDFLWRGTDVNEPGVEVSASGTRLQAGRRGGVLLTAAITCLF